MRISPLHRLRKIGRQFRYVVLFFLMFPTAIRLQIAEDFVAAEMGSNSEKRRHILRLYGHWHYGLFDEALDLFVATNYAGIEDWSPAQLWEFYLWFFDHLIPKWFVREVYPTYQKRHLRRFCHHVRSL